MNQLSSAVVADANILIALCSKEDLTFQSAEKAFRKYIQSGWEFFAPNIIVAEVLYILCQKLSQGILTDAEHDRAIEVFEDYMTGVLLPENGESALIKRAVEIREG